MYKEDNGAETHLNKIEARAGSRNKTNRNALIGGLLLVIIVFAVIVGAGFLQSDRNGAAHVNADNAAVGQGAR